MTLNEYQQFAVRTSPEGHDRVKNGCMGLIGECGEMMDVLKKHMFQSGDNPPPMNDRMLDECGDVMWYLAELATGRGWTLKEISETDLETWPCYRKKLPEKEVPNGLLIRAICFLALSCYDKMDTDEYMEQQGALVKNEDYDLSMEAAKDTMHAMMRLIEQMAERMGATLQEVMERNIQKLRKRYPEGFDAERSLHREGENHDAGQPV